MKSDAELVNAVLDGERETYSVLVARYERSVRATALAILRDHHAAQDVAQDAFVSAYEKLGRLRNPAMFGSWVARIARNTALTAARQRQRRTTSDLPEHLSGSSNHEATNEAFQALLAAVMRLSNNERTVVMLKYFEGLSVTDISEMIGRPVGTVTVQLSRARKRLRNLLKEFES